MADYEKANQKLEKQNKKLKKKNAAGGRVIIFLLLVIAVLAAVMFFLDPFGWGIGPNSGQANSGSDTSASDTAAQDAADTTAENETPAETESSQAYTDVTVSGATYIFGTQEATIDDIIKVINDSGEDILVNIYDNDATQNAMEALTSALEANGTAYSIQ